MVPRKQQLALFGAFVLMAVAGVANTGLPLLSGKLVDRVHAGVTQHEPQAAIFQTIAVLLGAIAALVFLRELLGVARRYLVEKTCTRIEQQTTLEVVNRLMRADLSTLTHEKIGVLHGRVFRSVSAYLRLLRLSFLDFFPAVLIGLLSIGVAVAKQPALGLALAGIIPISLSLTVWQLISQRRVRLQLLKVSEEMDGIIVEQFGGLDYIRVANTLDWELDRVAVAAQRKRKKELRHHVAMSLFGAGKAMIEGLFHVGVMAFAAYLAIHGAISFGDILTFSMLYLSAMAPLNEIHRVLDEGHEASLRVMDLQKLLALPNDPSFDTSATVFPEDAPAVVQVKALSVQYQLTSGESRAALNDVSLTIHHGETVGIAGKTGCGKSTWLKVLTRLLHPKEGEVWLKGMPIANISRQAIGDQIGYVGQNPFIFAGTIRENIEYGLHRSCTDEEVERAARLAAIHEEINAMPNGYQTPVAEKGQNLSGGQRQRLALARVFLRNPPILILDEATSALDTISERLVQKAIGTANRDRTVIMVAHRLSTFVDADRIFVFDDGRIAEVGSYRELIEKNGLFAELVRCSEVSPANG
ncbi:ABC transporter ATP-binding protein [Limnoglobus roseus]|nr:ABC transporter ATP-binding protein [Limnoglobus roseus]